MTDPRRTGSGGAEPGGAEPGGAEFGRVDPRRAFRGPASACLVLEAIVLPLDLLVMAKAEGGLTAPGVVLVLALTVGMLVGCVVILRPWGLAYAVGLQLVMVAGWVVSPALGVTGLIFLLVWGILLWMRKEVIRRQALWDARSAAADHPG